MKSYLQLDSKQRNVFLLSSLFLSLIFSQSVYSQFTFEFDYETPNPALEDVLNTSLVSESYKVFTFNADSIYKELHETPDSLNLTFQFENLEFEFTLNNYSIFPEDQASYSESYSKRGIVNDDPLSTVYARFSEKYFWLDILLDTNRYSILPVRTISETLKSYSNKYIIIKEVIEENADPKDDGCEAQYLDLLVLFDKKFYDKYDNDAGFIEDNLNQHINRIQSWFNQVWSSQVGPIEFRVRWQIRSDMQFNSSLDATRSNCIYVNTIEYPCLDFDMFIAISGYENPPGLGESFLGTVCNSYGELIDRPEYPGVSRINYRDYLNFEYPIVGVVPRFTLVLAHEMLHLMGAVHVSGACGNCATDCSYLMCSVDCAQTFKIDNCTKNSVRTVFNTICETCFSEFSDPGECVHCEQTAEVLINGNGPLVPMCVSSNEFSFTYTYYNDCDQKTIHFAIPYLENQIEIISGAEHFTDYDLGDDHVLEGPNVTLGPEEILSYTIIFRLIDDPYSANGTGVETNILGSSMTVFQGSNVILNAGTYPVFLTFVKPIEITGDKRLSQLLEPTTNFIFPDDNITGCSVTNKTFHLNGKLYIDNDYCFYKTNIILEGESSIVIQDGYNLDINQCKVFSCETMSEGFYVESGGTLNILNSDIRDAISAIELESGSSLTTTNSIYKNNYYGIKSHLTTQGDINLDVLAGNQFIADDELTKYPYIGYKSFAGISLKNVNFSTIEGDLTGSEQSLNKFDNLAYGIILSNSDATISNFRMSNIKPITNYVTIKPGGEAISIIGFGSNSKTTIGNSDYQFNYFESCKTGIVINSADADVLYCKFANIETGISLGYNPKGEISIIRNNIDAKMRGIYGRLSLAADVEIFNNDILMSGENSIGIDLLASWGIVEIDHNRFYLSNSKSGVNLINCNNLTVTSNKFVFTETTDQMMKGISTYGSLGCLFGNNKVYGSDLTNNTVAYYSQDSPTNNVYCNNAFTVNICEQYTGVNSLTSTFGNQYGESDYGLLLGSEVGGSEAIIGQQYQRQNKWQVSIFGQKGAWTLSQDPETNEQSRYIVDATQPYYYPPNITELTNIQWFQHETHQYNPNICHWIFPSNVLIPSSDYSFLVNEDTKNYNLKRQLFDALRFGLLDSVLTPSLNTFYNKLDTTDIGKLSNAKFYLYKAMTDSQNAKSTNIATALQFNSNVRSNDDIISLEVETNNLIADYIEEGDLETLNEELEFISNTALLCPYEYGPAVYLNRAILKSLDIEADFDDLDICGSIEPRSDRSSNTASINVFPNPILCNEELKISVSKQVICLAIQDIYGRPIQEMNLTNQNELSYSFLFPGVYFIRFKFIDNRIEFKKVVVVE